VGVLPAVTPGLIPRALLLLKRGAPHTRVWFRRVLWTPCCRSCAAIPWHGRRAPGPSDLAGDLSEETLDEGLSPLLSRVGNPLAAKRKIRWRTSPHIHGCCRRSDRCSVSRWSAALQQNGCALPADFIETLSVHVINGYLRSSEAIGSLSRVAAHHYIEMGVLAQLPLALPAPSVSSA